MTTTSRDPAVLLDDARQGSRVGLARLLTMIERGGAESLEVAKLVYATAPPYSVGLTGAPGAGKSTLTDQLITTARRGWPEVENGAAEAIEQVSVCLLYTSDAADE